MIAGVLQANVAVREYITSRGLASQYEKAKTNLIEGRLGVVRFKKRKPITAGIYQFRITDNYRAFCYFEGPMLVVFTVDDHQ